MDHSQDEISEAARTGNVRMLEYYLDAGAHPDSMSLDEKRATLLFDAAFVAKSLPCVQLLLARGANVNKQNDDKNATALIGAAYNGDLEIVKALLAAGANKDIRSRSHSGQKAIDFAKSRNHPHVADFIKAYVYVPKPDCDEVIYNHKIADRTLQEIFNFKSLERVTFIRKTPTDKVEAVLRDRFSTLQDELQLRAAFDEHIKRGGTRTEAEVFQIQRIRKLTSQP